SGDHGGRRHRTDVGQGRAPEGRVRPDGSARAVAATSRRRLDAALLALALTLLLVVHIGPAGGAESSAWQALRAPGAGVVLRHSTAPGTFDPPDARRDDCATQRNLDANGRAQAHRVGEAFRQRGITVDAVLSSPRCRCLDTARLAFGTAEAWEPLQG